MFNSRSTERTHMSVAAERPERRPLDSDPARGIALGVVIGAVIWLAMIATAIAIAWHS